MVINILKNGERVEDLTGYTVPVNEQTEIAYKVMSQTKGEQQHDKSGVLERAAT